MFSFLAAIFGAVWIQEHKTEVIVALAVIVALVVFLIVRRKRKQAAYLALPVIYIGNKATKTYHCPDCRMVSGIAPANRVGFRLRGEPERFGFTRCGSCKP